MRRTKIGAGPWWQPLQLAILIAATCWLIRKWVNADYSQLGLARWRDWSPAEQIYLAQIVPITLLVFSFLTSAELKSLWTRPYFWQAASTVLLTQMIWGTYQELMYRGVLQTGLVNRLGTPWGILTSNLIFTFGPLHAYHFNVARVHHQHLWIFAGIFSTGLIFAILFRNSENLWIVMGLHGIGDFFIDGLAHLARLLR